MKITKKGVEKSISLLKNIAFSKKELNKISNRLISDLNIEFFESLVTNITVQTSFSSIELIEAIAETLDVSDLNRAYHRFVDNTELYYLILDFMYEKMVDLFSSENKKSDLKVNLVKIEKGKIIALLLLLIVSQAFGPSAEYLGVQEGHP